jgi:hypothetical protein
MTRATLAAILLCCLPLPLRAADEPKPNTLTAKEVEEGWILLFDGETTVGWTANEKNAANIGDGALVIAEKFDGRLVTTTKWSQYELRFDYRSPKDGKCFAVLSCDQSGADSRHSLPLSLSGKDWTQVRVTLENDLVRWQQRPIDAKSTEQQEGDLRVTSIPAGTIALQGSGLRLRNIRLRPLYTNPLFNSKDLTGWKKFDKDPAKAKSEFSVTKDGEIHMKNGPGDLQTEKQWADFILQIDCKTNGDRLNSGVFFRCIPDEYQQGYESQIHNGFTDKPEKEYTIEEFDPDSHKPTGSKKVKYQAQDYGTGGIYRRIPARQPVAKDKEWFTMTVVAQGRHIATWVNGIQVVDWTDNRPENDNARNGCKLGKGAISLQGHDATTDILFRNIRIAELK